MKQTASSILNTALGAKFQELAASLTHVSVGLQGHSFITLQLCVCVFLYEALMVVLLTKRMGSFHLFLNTPVHHTT